MKFHKIFVFFFAKLCENFEKFSIIKMKISQNYEIFKKFFNFYKAQNQTENLIIFFGFFSVIEKRKFWNIFKIMEFQWFFPFFTKFEIERKIWWKIASRKKETCLISAWKGTKLVSTEKKTKSIFDFNFARTLNKLIKTLLFRTNSCWSLFPFCREKRDEEEPENVEPGIAGKLVRLRHVALTSSKSSLRAKMKTFFFFSPSR